MMELDLSVGQDPANKSDYIDLNYLVGLCSRWLRRGVALLLGILCFVSSGYGSSGGERDPIMSIGAPVVSKVDLCETGGNGFGEKGISDDNNAVRSVWVFSRLCKITTDAVVTNTAIATNPAIPNDRSINCSQECRSSPNIRLTFLEKAVFLILAASAAGILIVMVWVLVVFRREHDGT